MTDETSDIIDHYIEQKKKGMDFSEIRKELKEKNLDSDKIKFIIREVDNQMLFEAQDKSFKVSFNETKIIGLVLMFGGGFITVFTFFGVIDLGGTYLIAYGPIIGGYLLYLQSRRSINRNKRSRL